MKVNLKLPPDIYDPNLIGVSIPEGALVKGEVVEIDDTSEKHWHYLTRIFRESFEGRINGNSETSPKL